MRAESRTVRVWVLVEDPFLPVFTRDNRKFSEF